MEIDLQKFCDTSATRYHLEKPWSLGDYTYATDGKIGIRIARRSDVEECAAAPNIEKLFADAEARGPYVWVDVPGVTVEVVKCDDCEGRGWWSERNGTRNTCENCDGEGAYKRREPVRFDIDGVAVGLSNVYLELILQSLPGAKIGLIKEAATTFDVSKPINGVPVKIKFDGGDGLLMPMRLTGVR